MVIPSLQFTPRARRSFESMDLGLSLLQAHLGPVARVLALQMSILLALTLPFLWFQPVWALLILWWLSPWLSRGVLHVLSRRVFGQDAGVMSFLGHAREVHGRGLLASLLWRRLSPTRTFLLPVWQLEMQRGRAYRQRIQVLRREGGGSAFLLSLVCLLFIALTLLGCLGILQMMIPRGMGVNLWETLLDGFRKPWFAWLFTGLGILAIALVEPFFTAAGFSLYLNRRTVLEAWDLEQAFRRLAARLQAKARVILLMALIGGLGLAQEIPPSPVKVQDIQAPLHPEDPALKQVREILEKDPAFRSQRDVRKWTYKPTGKERGWVRALLDALFGESKPKAEKPRHLDLSKWLNPLALVVKIVCVALLILGALYLIYRFHHARQSRLEIDDYVPPDAVAGLDIRPSSLPADIPGEALRLFRMGDPRQALALLYRGALVALVHGHGLEIPASATEGDCLKAAQDLTLHAAFSTLTQAWIPMAYLGEAPDETVMLALIAQWPQAFGNVPSRGGR